MASTREQIITKTCDLMENQGYHATGLNQICKESGAPKGSIYYHFPAGKEEIAVEAIQWAGKEAALRIRQALVGEMVGAESIPATVSGFVRNIAHFVEVSGFQAGGPLTAVAMETATTNDRLNRSCREAYGQIQAAFRDTLLEGGYAPEHAAEMAAFITSSIEGGVILSRVYHSGDPLRNVAQQLEQLLKTCAEQTARAD